ncbi:hypothetical protein C8J57DRAFT_1240456 [Mycena rebaudengoi]|nr:hypothetical protein C8J57DRAFT_1240456 [Mycena rebaudengoi]
MIIIGDALGPPQILAAIGLILMASWLLVLLAASMRRHLTSLRPITRTFSLAEGKLRFLTGVCKPPHFWGTDRAQLVSASSGSAGQVIPTSGGTNDIMGSTGSNISHSVHRTPLGNHGHPSPSVAAGSSQNTTASTVTGSHPLVNIREFAQKPSEPSGGFFTVRKLMAPDLSAQFKQCILLFI